jgi:hypothetical protein
MPAIETIAWNFHAGIPDVSMGRGGSVLAQDPDLDAALRQAGWETRAVRVEPVEEDLTEARPPGRSLDAVLAAIDATFDRFDVGAAALTAYDPHVDEDGAIAAAARAIAGRIAEAEWRSRAA